MRIGSWALMGATATLLAGSAEAMPTPAPYRAEPVITLAAGGCGIGFHRNVYGACVVNGPGWGGAVVAPGYYGYGAPGYWHGGYYHGAAPTIMAAPTITAALIITAAGGMAATIMAEGGTAAIIMAAAPIGMGATIMGAARIGMEEARTGMGAFTTGDRQLG